jgi:hypothetical protein
MTLRSGVELAPNFRFNASQPFFHWVINGGIRTDGSEETLGFLPVPDRIEPMVLPPIAPATAERLFESFGAWQRGERAQVRGRDNSKVYRLKRKLRESQEATDIDDNIK